MLVHPRLLFLYWVRDTELDSALARAGGPARMAVEVSADGRSFREVAREEFDFRAPSWYVHSPYVDCHLRVQLGLLEDGRFRPLVASNVIRVPRESAGTGAEVWSTLDDLRGADAERATARPRRVAAGAPRPAAGGNRSSPGRLAWGQPSRARGARPGAPGRAAALGYVCFVLHCHLPFIRHPEREYFLEERWLFEAITETYLPLLDGLEHLGEDGVPARITVSLTPTLMAMLRDPVLMGKYQRHLEGLCELARREVERTRRDPDFSPVAGFYRDRLERFRHLFTREYERDLVGEFARLESEGLVEIIACAATHGLLPHLALARGNAWAQIAVGVAEHRRQIGRPPRGIWLPECAYFEGLDDLLARAGLDYFFIDAHALRSASSRPRLDLHAPVFCPAGVAAFGRDEECSTQVWSAEQGYPGDPSYRDFYRDIGFDLDLQTVGPFLDPTGIRGMTGLKYFRISGRTPHKEPYRREWALRTAERHASDFVSNRRRQLSHLASKMDREPLVVAMYDAELFGHWWFEGPEWLEAVLRKLPQQGLRAISPSQYLAENPVGQVAEPPASSWGDKGYYEVWLGAANDWIYPPLHDAGRRMMELASRASSPGSLERRVLAQAGRELLLAQASDWPFILTNHTAEEFARRRIHDHLERFDRLARQIEEGRLDEAYLGRVEAQDNLFPDLDYQIWRHP